MSLFDDVKTNLVEWYSISSEKTAEVAKVTTRRYDKFGISRDIERQFGELGSLIYNGFKDDRRDMLEDPAVAALIERIKGLEGELILKNDEIDSIQREYSDRRARPAAAPESPETVITQPILDEGGEESAILVEPIVVDVEDPPKGEAVFGENVDESSPEKDA